jgi:hypothetical protein
MRGGTPQDVAALAGGFNPTGTITLRLYALGVNPTVGPAAYVETVGGSTATAHITPPSALRRTRRGSVTE